MRTTDGPNEANDRADGSIPRREAFRKLLRAGVSGQVAAASLGLSASAWTAEPSKSREQLTQALTSNLYKLVDNAQFQADLAAVAGEKNLSKQRSKATAFINQWASLESLNGVGVDPINTKISFRVFELPKSATKILNSDTELAAESFVFLPTTQIPKIKGIQPANSVVAGTTARLKVGIGQNLTSVDSFAPGDTPLPTTEGWGVCVSSGPGGIACISVGYQR